MPKARCRPGAAVADLRAGHQRRALAEAGCRRSAAGALRDVLIDLAVLVGAGAKALHRGDDHARVGLVDVLPGQAHAVERAGREILDQHVAMLDQALEDVLALGMLGIDRDRALVAVEHREVERVGALHVAQLAAGDVADAGPLHLDAVGAHVAEELRAGRARLHVGEVEHLDAVERLAGLAPWRSGGLWRSVAGCGLFLRRELHDFACRALHRLHDLARGGLFSGFRFRLRFLGHGRPSYCSAGIPAKRYPVFAADFDNCITS